MPTNARERLLTTADDLFYAEGIRAVGVERILSVSGVGRASFYRHFPSKDDLVVAVLRRRDEAWRAWLTERVDALGGQPLNVFDALAERFARADFRGCAFINSYAELGPTSESIADVVRSHKRALRKHLTGVIAEAGYPDSLADQLLILANGAMVTAAIAGSPDPARQARSAARTLLDAASCQPAGLGHSSKHDGEVHG